MSTWEAKLSLEGFFARIETERKEVVKLPQWFSGLKL